MADAGVDPETATFAELRKGAEILRRQWVRKRLGNAAVYPAALEVAERAAMLAAEFEADAIDAGKKRGQGENESANPLSGIAMTSALI